MPSKSFLNLLYTKELKHNKCHVLALFTAISKFKTGLNKLGLD